MKAYGYLLPLFCTVFVGCDLVELDQFKLQDCLQGRGLPFQMTLTTDSKTTDPDVMGDAVCRSVAAISAKMNRPYDEVAKSVTGLSLEIVGSEVAFDGPDGTEKRGLAFCSTKFVRLANDNWHSVVLTHELVHIALCPEIEDNYAHKDWEVNGAREATFLGMVPHEDR